MNLGHFGELRQGPLVDSRSSPLHLPDGKVHPGERQADQREQNHEAAGPDPGQVAHRAEHDRQDEAAKPADHADHAANGADMIRIIDRDMFVDRSLAQRHEEAEHENGQDERHQAHRGGKSDVALDPVDDIVRRGIGQHEQAQERDAKGHVHDLAGAILVGKDAAIGAKQAGREREGGGQHAGRFHIDAVHTHQIPGQPQRQRYERPEHKEIIEREPPDLLVLQGFKLFAQRLGLGSGKLACGELGVVLAEQEKDHRDSRECSRPDLGNRCPPHRYHDEGRGKLGYSRTDIAHSEDAQRGPLFFLRVPFGNISDAHRKPAPGQSHSQRCQQHHWEGVSVGKQKGRSRRSQHRCRENEPPAVLIGPHPQEHADQRTGQDRRSDQEAELRVAEAQIGLDLDPDDRKDRPDGEADRKGKGAQAQSAVLIDFWNRNRHRHGLPSGFVLCLRGLA